MNLVDNRLHREEQRSNINTFGRSMLSSLYLAVPQSEGDVVELVNVGRFDGSSDDLGVDSDFPSLCIARVVGDTRVAARLQDVTDAVVSHKHHWHTSWWTTKVEQKSMLLYFVSNSVSQLQLCYRSRRAASWFGNIMQYVFWSDQLCQAQCVYSTNLLTVTWMYKKEKKNIEKWVWLFDLFLHVTIYLMKNRCFCYAACLTVAIRQILRLVFILAQMLLKQILTCAPEGISNKITKIIWWCCTAKAQIVIFVTFH